MLLYIVLFYIYFSKQIHVFCVGVCCLVVVAARRVASRDIIVTLTFCWLWMDGWMDTNNSRGTHPQLHAIHSIQVAKLYTTPSSDPHQSNSWSVSTNTANDNYMQIGHYVLLQSIHIIIIENHEWIVCPPALSPPPQSTTPQSIKILSFQRRTSHWRSNKNGTHYWQIPEQSPLYIHTPQGPDHSLNS